MAWRGWHWGGGLGDSCPLSAHRSLAWPHSRNLVCLTGVVFGMFVALLICGSSRPVGRGGYIYVQYNTCTYICDCEIQHFTAQTIIYQLIISILFRCYLFITVKTPPVPHKLSSCQSFVNVVLFHPTTTTTTTAFDSSVRQFVSSSIRQFVSSAVRHFLTSSDSKPIVDKCTKLQASK